MRTIEKVDAPVIFEFNTLAQKLAEEGTKIFHLGQAVTDLRPPKECMERLAEISKKTDIHSYLPDAGILDLRRAIVDTLLAKDGVVYDPATEMIITAGANHAYLLALLTVTDPGDEVVLLSPYYFDHGMAVEMLSRKKVEVPLQESDTWDLDLAKVEAAITPKTKAVTLVNPHNPTGAVFAAEKIEKLHSLCRKRGIWLISDEVYDRFVFEGKLTRPASLGKEDVITISSLSKTTGIMGWRIGFLASTKEIVDQAIKAQDATLVCACHAGQALALDLLKTDPFPGKDYIRTLVERRDTLRQGLVGVKQLEWREPKGALFAAVRLKQGLSPHETAKKLLTEKGVLTTPMERFGQAGSNHLRLSFGLLDKKDLAEAAKLIREFFKT